MYWQALIADLDGEFEAGLAAEFHSEVADRSRREAARLRLVDRLRPAVGSRVTLRVTGAGPVAGVLESLGPDWLLLAVPPARELLVPSHAVLTLGGLSARSAAPGSEGRVAARLGFGHALRGVARGRAPVTVVLVDGGTLFGSIDRVGRDFVEVTDRRPDDDGGRPGAVQAVPLAAIALVRTD